jgi:hypothetical protein
VAPEPSRYSGPLPFEEARTEMDMLNHRRFLGGDCGLVEPE